MRWFRKRPQRDPTFDVAALYAKLGAAASGAAVAIEEYVGIEAPANSALRHTRLFTELFAFYLHVMDRTVTEELGLVRRDRLLGIYEDKGVQVIRSIIQGFISDEDRREDVFHDTLSSVDRAIVDYKSASTLGTADDHEDLVAPEPHSSIGKFCRNVAQALDAEDNTLYRRAALMMVDMGLEKEEILRVGRLL